MLNLIKNKFIIISYIFLAAILVMGCEDVAVDETSADLNPAKVTELNRATAITVSTGSLSPAFSHETSSYAVAVANDTAAVTVTPSCINAECNFSLMQDGKLTSNPVNLTAAVTEIIITVNESATVQSSYTISFNRITTANLLQNPSFELTADGNVLDWQLISSGSFIAETNSIVSYGNNIGYFNKLTSSISGREIQSAEFAIDTAKPLQLSADFYTTVDPSRTKVSLKIWYYQDAECTIPAADVSNSQRSLNLDVADIWQTVSYEQSADNIPEDAAFAKLSIRVMYASDYGTSEDIVYVDNAIAFQE